LKKFKNKNKEKV